MYQLEVKNVGRLPESVTIWDESGRRKIAMFMNHDDAKEAAAIIRVMRTDTAFEWVKVI